MSATNENKSKFGIGDIVIRRPVIKELCGELSDLPPVILQVHALGEESPTFRSKDAGQGLSIPCEWYELISGITNEERLQAVGYLFDHNLTEKLNELVGFVRDQRVIAIMKRNNEWLESDELEEPKWNNEIRPKDKELK